MSFLISRNVLFKFTLLSILSPLCCPACLVPALPGSCVLGQARLKEGRGCRPALGGSPHLGCFLQLALSLSPLPAPPGEAVPGQCGEGPQQNKISSFHLSLTAPKPLPGLQPQSPPHLLIPAPDGLSGAPPFLLLGLVLGRRSQEALCPCFIEPTARGDVDERGCV